MSRSRTRIPVTHWHKQSKWWKRYFQKKLRRLVHMGNWHLRLREVSDLWSAPADGHDGYLEKRWQTGTYKDRMK